MKWGKFRRVFVLTLVLALSIFTILYKLLIPKPSDMDFGFLQNHLPLEIRLSETPDSKNPGVEVARYFWYQSFAQAEADVTSELLRRGWRKEITITRRGFKIVTFIDPNEGWMHMVNGDPQDVLSSS